MEEIKLGGVVRFKSWITSDHLATIWLRFDNRQVSELLRSRFFVEDVFHHHKFGMVATVSLRWRPGDRPNICLDWPDDSYVKLCYIEVAHE
jgi:hypothetical protein